MLGTDAPEIDPERVGPPGDPWSVRWRTCYETCKMRKARGECARRVVNVQDAW